MQTLKNLFRAFLRSHRMAGLFGRQPMPAGGPSTAVTVPAAQVQALQSAACSPVAALLQQLDTSSRGLSPEQVRQRQLRHGPNEVAHEKPLPAWKHLWHCYRNPFNLLLTLLAVVSYVTEDEKATIVIASMVLLSTLLRFVQEGRSRRAAARLQALVSNRVTVRRKTDAPAADFRDSGGGHDTSLSELPMRELVPGDIVALSAGDMIPADCRLLSAKDLFVSQAAMTGESLPVEKDARPLAALQAGQLLEAGNLLFMGTNVVSGSAMAVVVATGNQSYFGTLAARITHQDRTATAFEQGVNSVSWLLIRFAAVMVPVVLFINGYTKGDWGEAFLFALSVAVGLTPEMLPMIVTSTLAKGAVVLSRQKVMVKRLDAIQNFGAMDVLCTDKTGTLTQDRIALERHTDVQGRPSDEVLQFAYLNSYYQTGLKNLLDRAVLEHVELHTRLHVNENYRKVDEIPFDFQRRRMSVVVAERNHHHELICKGAVEEVLQVCTHIRDSGRDGDTLLPLTPERREQVRAVTEGLNSEGLRVVAVAMKEVPPDKNTYGIADEAELTLIGYVAFLDPPKESTQAAIAALLQHGVAVKVLTGDNELVARKVCRDVGLQVDEAIVGNDIEAMDEAQLRRCVESHLLFARLTPLHKERIVRALRANGHVTGFMGDGINDAPALRAADIGISVDSGVDIAREAADIILLEKSLMVLEQGVLEGRRTFSNMLKYIRMTASSNFGNVFSVLIASAFIPFLPMLPMQLLMQNLLYDLSQIAIPFDHVDEEMVARPLRWDPQDLGRFMLFFGPISSLFDVLTFALMWFVFHASTVAEQSLFQSGWFVVGLLTQTLIVHMIRTPKIPFVQSRASWPLLAATAAIMAIGIFLPMGPLAGHFKLQTLPLGYFPWLIVILLAYAVLTTLLKRVYIRKYGW
ncbi:magnesium-translocating P-type ATPase [Comamonas thiooxydans]|uniref:magnesium-translocating P-type ATPase n=2 Tax=Comamonas thiooxydans TaxID=363952 RepID=UPI0001BB190D|nr:magnesium-translocating P-type ATPase [Comamonas thiooxydans]ACY35031.1 magnesium-translocating P-type ATPase [Comamonas thiooxydans]MDO1473532.1 magnesium-translocating P-type ATPase [Comamonas thiooxydans]